ncbi:MAG: cytochrome c [Myxococcota bacterium]
MRAVGAWVLVGAGCAAHVSSDQVAAVTALSGDPTRGQALYTDRCDECHHQDGHGKGVDLPSAVSHHDAAALAQVVLSGPSIMPNFVHSLEPQQVADVVAYLTQAFGT